MSDGLPVLWQYSFSNYNEKARWALDFKGIRHRRHSVMPGWPRNLWLSRGDRTLPLLDLDARRIMDSTRIIAALEERVTDPALYPADPEERRRALELEDYFDEELGPHIRRAVYQELLPHPDLVVPLFTEGASPFTRGVLRAGFPVLRVGMRRFMNIYEEPAARSRVKCVEVLDSLERELGDNEYLVGDSFSIADLTAASLFYPIALPAEFPYTSPSWDELPEGARDFLGEMRERPGAHWVGEMYRRHRLPA